MAEESLPFAICKHCSDDVTRIVDAGGEALGPTEGPQISRDSVIPEEGMGLAVGGVYPTDGLAEVVESRNVD